MKTTMKQDYVPGEGCQCSARCSCECGCDVDWTPREVYELREQRDRLAYALRELRVAVIIAEQDYSTGDQRGLVQTVNGAEFVPLYDAIDFAG